MTLTELPGGELPAEWGPVGAQPQRVMEHERKGSKDEEKKGEETMDLDLDLEALGADFGEPDGMGANAATRMNAGHMVPRQAVWMEKIASFPLRFPECVLIYFTVRYT